jgi:hypothetical protein
MISVYELLVFSLFLNRWLDRIRPSSSSFVMLLITDRRDIPLSIASVLYAGQH